MRKQTLFAAALVAALAVASHQTANAVIIASDDFTATDSGVGWATGDEWEYLQAEESRVLVEYNQASWRELASPVDISNQVTYMRMTYQRVVGNTSFWGGVSLFDGTQESPGRELFKLGRPAGMSNYGADTLGDKLDSIVRTNTSLHELIVEIDTTNQSSFGEVNYKLWIDNHNYDAPADEVLVTGISPEHFYNMVGVLRMQAQTNAFDRVYGPLTIATDPIEVGLVPAGAPQLTINRTTGEVSLSNVSSVDGVVGYTLSSAGGSFNTANWTTITGNYDNSPGGDGSVDTDDLWNVVSDLSNTELSE
ncbi:hypothetical protein [Aeoliella mucimassa]|nr:hypothetical protein [Aeoliella mucimassa]